MKPIVKPIVEPIEKLGRLGASHGALQPGKGMISGVIALTIGSLLGVLAAYVGGRFEQVVMRIVDIQLGFPAILVALILLAVLVLKTLVIACVMSERDEAIHRAQVSEAASLSPATLLGAVLHSITEGIVVPREDGQVLVRNAAGDALVPSSLMLSSSAGAGPRRPGRAG